MGRRFILSTIIPFCFASSASFAMENFCLPTMYIGADAQVRNISFARNYGGNIYKREYPQTNIYLGLKGNEYIGIESGSDFNSTRTRSVFLPAGSVFLGVPQPFDLRLNTLVRFRSLHTSLIGFIPICNNEDFKFIIAAGVVNLKIRLENIVTEANSRQTFRKLTFTQSKSVVRLMTGVQYMFCDYVGIRANIRWENTAHLKRIEPIRVSSINVAKVKNSFIYGLGFVIQF